MGTYYLPTQATAGIICSTTILRIRNSKSDLMYILRYLSDRDSKAVFVFNVAKEYKNCRP